MPERHWHVRPLDPVYAIVYLGEDGERSCDGNLVPSVRVSTLNKRLAGA